MNRVKLKNMITDILKEMIKEYGYVPAGSAQYRDDWIKFIKEATDAPTKKEFNMLLDALGLQTIIIERCIKIVKKKGGKCGR